MGIFPYGVYTPYVYIYKDKYKDLYALCYHHSSDLILYGKEHFFATYYFGFFFL